jgi:3-oxoadipate enol-lactonase
MSEPSSGLNEVKYVDGPLHQLGYRRGGEGQPLVLLHPLALSGEAWGDFGDRLAQHFDVIALDARGHGNSGWDGAPFTVGNMAEDVVTLLDGLGLQTAHLVGMSMGGSTAVVFAGLHADRVDGLLLADTTAWYGPEAPATWEERAVNVIESPRARLVPFQVDRWFTERFRQQHPDLVNRAVDVFLRTDSLAHAEACRALGTMDSRALLTQIQAPTLVVTGAEDYATPPEMGQTIATGVQQGATRVLDALRHMSLIEAPELAATVVEHLQQERALA